MSGSAGSREEKPKRDFIEQFVDRYKEWIGIVLSLLIIVGLGVVLHELGAYEEAVFRYILVGFLTIIPAVMYFVFIALKKTSLFHEYISNLFSLGLLYHYRCDAPDDKASAHSVDYFNRSRIQSYLRRFEAVYGPIKKDLSQELLAITGNHSAPATEFEKSQISKDSSSGIIFSFSTAIPVFLATALICVGWMLYLPPMEETMREKGLHAVLAGERNLVLYGFLGAYFFSLQMLFRRFVINDLRAKAYINVSIRIVLALISAWVLLSIPGFSGGVATEAGTSASESVVANYSYLIAFIIGVFPPVLWRYIRTVVSRIQFTSMPEFENKLPVTELDGLTIWHQSRLEEEDIESSFNVANADILQLMLNTKIPSDRIIDWVDQAILLTCISYSSNDSGGNSAEFQQRKNRLQELGLRTATMLDSLVVGHSDSTLEPMDILTQRLKQRGAQDSEIPPITGLFSAIENYTNIHLVRNWKDRSNRVADESMHI